MYSAVDTLWILLAVILMFMMQAGFAMLETGFTRAKNAGNIAMKNLLDFVVGSLVFWIIGFGLLHNTSVGGFIGIPDLFTQGDYSQSGFPGNAYFIFQVMFCATAATIVSGAMAERTKFQAYLICSAILSAFVYPVAAHWIWNADGWLNKLGFHDFAGSTAVHLVGGMAALVGAKMLGPRIGKYDRKGKSKAIPGHNLSLGVLGIFLLWFGWYGFDAGSTLTITGDDAIKLVSSIVVNVTFCASASCLMAMLVSWRRYGKADITMTFNGALAGLVAVTSGCDQVTITGAVCIGLITGFILVFAIEFVDMKLKVDDPVGAVSAHGISGALGTVFTGVFSTKIGLLHTGKLSGLLIQCLGVICVCAWVIVCMSIVFVIMKKTIGIRVSEDDEMKGLDFSEHGMAPLMAGDGESYSAMASPQHLVEQIDMSVPDEDAPLPEKYKVTDGKMRMVMVMMNPNRLEVLMKALDRIEITGMTVTNVSGCGIQKGNTEYYRGAELESHLIPKVKVEIVICAVPLALVIDTIKKSIYTGKIGDGKIFVYEIDDVIKVRTGSQGREALE